MIKTNKINIVINTNKVRKKYEELGYIIPDKYLNSVIEIDIKDLNKTSHKTIECECDVCGKINKTTYLSYNKSINNHNYYSCSGKCSVLKIKKVKKEKYGDEKYNNIEKNKETCFEKYGVENVFQNDEVKNKSKFSIIKKYGVENPSQSNEVKNKKFKTCFSNYGVKHHFQLSEIKENIKNTNLDKYGCQNPMQNLNIFNKKLKTSFSKKSFDTLFYQGSYELDFLKKYYFIGIEKIKPIEYNFENKNKIYFPDFYYKPLNLIIEIKSNYTFNKELNKNLAKEKSCLDRGYNFIFIIDKKYENFQKILDNI